MYSPLDANITETKSNESLITTLTELQALAIVLSKDVLFLLSMLLVCPTLYFFTTYRRSLYTDPIYIIWRNYFSTRIVLLALIPLSTLHYVPSVRNSAICILYSYRVLILFITIGAHQSLMLCVYQGIVMFMPVRFFRWRNSKAFRRVWITVLTVDWLWCVGFTQFFVHISGAFNYYTACYAHQRPFRTSSILTTKLNTIALYIMYINLFLPQIVQALIYIVYLLHSIFNRKKRKLTKEQRNIIRVQGQIALVGFFSFLSTFSLQMLNGFATNFIANYHAIRVGLLFVDRSFDPIWHYWRNSIFRMQINGKLGIANKTINVTSETSEKNKVNAM